MEEVLTIYDANSTHFR